MLIGGDESPLIQLSTPEPRRELSGWLSPGISDFVIPAIATVAGMLLVWFALGLNRIGEWLDRKRKP
jgi:ABC-type dipeptide/oligopeptide/nickel transport system permease subunit